MGNNLIAVNSNLVAGGQWTPEICCAHAVKTGGSSVLAANRKTLQGQRSLFPFPTGTKTATTLQGDILHTWHKGGASPDATGCLTLTCSVQQWRSWEIYPKYIVTPSSDMPHSGRRACTIEVQRNVKDGLLGRREGCLYCFRSNKLPPAYLCVQRWLIELV